MRPPSALLERLTTSRLLPAFAEPSVGTGERRSRRKGPGMEFIDHRPYQTGDDTRHLDPHLYARTADAHAALVARYPGTVEGAEGQLLIKAENAGSADALLAEFGTQLRQVSVDQPSLESVFLSLTGRDLREAPPTNAKKRGRG
jgi:hypothetical protein